MEGASVRLLALQRNETSGQLGTLHARNAADRHKVLFQSAVLKVFVKYKLPPRQIIEGKSRAEAGAGGFSTNKRVI